MGAKRESKSFRKGFVLGALAGAGAMIWNAPQPGERTREQIQDAIEGVLFKLLDIPEKRDGLRSVPAASEPAVVAAPAAPPPAEAGVDIVIDGPRPSEISR